MTRRSVLGSCGSSDGIESLTLREKFVDEAYANIDQYLEDYALFFTIAPTDLSIKESLSTDLFLIRERAKGSLLSSVSVHLAYDHKTTHFSSPGRIPFIETVQ